MSAFIRTLSAIIAVLAGVSFYLQLHGAPRETFGIALAGVFLGAAIVTAAGSFDKKPRAK